MKRKETDRESPGIHYRKVLFGIIWHGMVFHAKGVLFCSIPSIRRMSKRAIHGVRSLGTIYVVANNGECGQNAHVQAFRLVLKVVNYSSTGAFMFFRSMGANVFSLFLLGRKPR